MGDCVHQLELVVKDPATETNHTYDKSLMISYYPEYLLYMHVYIILLKSVWYGAGAD